MSEFLRAENEIKILETRIDLLTRSQIEIRLENILEDAPRQSFVVTLNPEIVLKARADDGYRNILNTAHLSLCDGFGLRLVMRPGGKKTGERYTGVDLTDFLLKRAKEEKRQVLIVVSKDSLSSPEEIKQSIEKKYAMKAQAIYWEEANNFFESNEAKSAEIVFVNFGAPRQEKFIFDHRKKFPRAKILSGVGGTFDFLTGRMRRAPRWMRKFGIEWLFRLVQEPKRARRIWNAVFAFPFYFYWEEK